MNMAVDPRMLAMMQQQGEAEGAAEPGDSSDEDMLEKVRMGMGNQEGPPPGSGMKWENLEDDQQALLDDPSPENIQAFVQYWGEDKLPPEIAQMAQGGGQQQTDQGPPGGGGPGGGMY